MFKPTKRTKKQFNKDIAEIEGWIAEVERDLREDNFITAYDYDRLTDHLAHLEDMLAHEHIMQDYCTEHPSVARWA